MNKRKLITSICIMVVLCLSLSAITYAWLRRDWKPSLIGEGIKIQTGSTLAIILDQDSPTTEVNLVDVLGMNSISLKQVSNLSGESNDFFSLYYGEDGIELKNAKVQHYTKPDGATDIEWKESRGYVEESFILASTTADLEYYQYVFLDPYSFIALPQDVLETPEGLGMLDSIRISITINTKTFGLKLNPEAHTGIINTKNSEDKYIANGVNMFEIDQNGNIMLGEDGREVYTQVPEEAGGNLISILGTDDAASSVFHTFEYYELDDGDVAPEGLTEAQKSRALCKLASNATTRVTVRIWLEGTAPGCITDISGMLFDLAIVFKGVTEAPTATPAN